MFLRLAGKVQSNHPGLFPFWDKGNSSHNKGVNIQKKNQVRGKRSGFLPTFVFRPLTPPYVPFGIRGFLFLVCHAR